MARLAVALGVGVAVLIALSISTGLLTGHPTGAGDNGDGIRLYCGAGIRATTPNGMAYWQGGVVLQFLRVPPCHNPIPSSAAVLLRVAVSGHAGTWSLTVLGWWYVAVLAVIATVATWAACRNGLGRALILLPATVPLVEPAFARFVLSTYSEPTGLVGLYALLCGIGVITVTDRADRVERWLGLLLVAGGGLVCATAKIGYLPILAVAVVVCGCTRVALRRGGSRRRSDRFAPIVLAAAILIITVPPTEAVRAWQLRAYGVVNVQDLVYTTVLEEVPGATRDLGLPQAAMTFAGKAYFPFGEGPVPGVSVLNAAPDKAQKDAVRVLVEHPAALLRSVGIAMQATEGRALTYLPSAPWTPTTVAPPRNSFTGEEGATAPSLAAWLNQLPLPWWPSLVALLGIAAGIVGLARRRRWSHYTLQAGIAAVSAVLMAVTAILGDGYFEIAKHVWLSAYCIDVTVLALLCAVVAALVRGRGGRREVAQVDNDGPDAADADEVEAEAAA